MNLFALSGLLACINSFTFGVFSWVKGKRFLNKIWAIFNLSVAIWGFGAYRFSTTLDKSAVFFWLRFGHIGVVLIPVLFIHFVFELLEEKRKNLIYLIYGIGLFFSILNITDWLGITKVFIVSLRFVFNSFYVDSPPGPIYPLFVAFFFGAVIYAHLRALKHLKLATGLKRMQIKYFLAATALGFGGGGTAFPMVFNINIYPILHFTVCLYPIIMTYAIFKYRLMDINLVLRGWLIFMPYAVISIVVFVIINILLHNLFWINMGTIVLLILSAPFLYQYLYRHSRMVIDSTIYRNKFTYIEKLEEFIAGMPLIPKEEDLLKDTAKILLDAFRVKKIGIFAQDPIFGNYPIRTQVGLDGIGEYKISNEKGLSLWLKNKKEAFIKEEAEKFLDNEEFNRIKETLDKLEATICVPALLEDELLGIITLSEKASGEMYTHVDIEILHRLGIQLAVALDYKRIETQLRKEQELADIGIMSMEISHELRNLLQMPQTFLDLALDRRNDEDFMVNFRKIALDRMNVVSNKLYDIMYFGKDRPLTLTQGVDIENLLDTNLAANEYSFKKNNVELVKEYAGIPKIKADKNQLTHVLNNLIINSLDAMKENGGKLRVRTMLNNNSTNEMLSKSDKWIRIEIKDDGTGIPEAILKKLFTPFVTTKSTGGIQRGGTGLGLAVAKKVVDAHKGYIYFNTKEGKGTTAVVDLPVELREELPKNQLTKEPWDYRD